MEPLEVFRARARDWLSAHRHQAPPNYGAILPPDLLEQGVSWQRRLFAGGFTALHWPKQYGGQGLTQAHTGAWLDECAGVDVPPFINMVGMVLAAGALLHHGTDEQRQQFLRPTAAGDIVWCQLFSEPDAGSDLAGLHTRADLHDDSYVVNGQKTWCSGGRCADWGILLARTDTAAPKHRGLSFFVVPMSSPGIDVRPLRQMTGESHFDEVFFSDLDLSASLRIGPQDEGWAVAMSVLSNERGHVGASATAVRRTLDELIAAADGRTISPRARARLVELIIRGRTLAWLAGRVSAEPLLGSLMKLGVTELMFDVALLRADLGGIAGLTEPQVVGPMLGAPGSRIAGGSSEIQRNIVGERLLGLPREPSVSPSTK